MKKSKIFLLLAFLSIAILFSEMGFAQMKPDKIGFVDMPIGTTATIIHFTTHSLKEITIINDDGTNYLIISWNGEIPCSLAITDGASTTASAVFTSATANFISAGVEIGDLIRLYEGTADDGVYEIKSVDSETQITLSSALTVTDVDIDFTIMHWRIKPGEMKTYRIHLDSFSLKASASTIDTRIAVTYLP
jgi:hypothetical protein